MSAMGYSIGWKRLPLKRIARLNPSKTERRASLTPETLVSFLPMERVSEDGRIAPGQLRKFQEVSSGYTYFARGDVIVAKITPCFENGKGASLSTLPTETGFGSTEFTVLRPTDQILPDFLYRVTQLPAFRVEGEQHMTGAAGQQRVRDQFIEQFPVLLPPLDEQAAIVKYLAHVDHKIDRFIRSKRRMIELLNEQKQAIIHQAVTKGLDPSVPMKDSGVEWLGEIPAHWETRPLSTYLSYLSYGFTNPMPATDAGPYMLTAADVGEGQINYNTARHTSEEAYQNLLTSKSRPKCGDILITKDGTLGRTAVVDREDICINQSVGVMRPRSELVDNHFLEALLRSAPYQLRMQFEAGGTTIKHIYISRLAKMAISGPPTLAEQIQLRTQMASVQIRFSQLVSGVNREIQLVQEYRKRLVSDVVTGKLNVSEIAAHLDKVPEQVSLDSLDAGAHEIDGATFSTLAGDVE